MIGFAVTAEQAQAANDAVALAQSSRGLPVFWLPGNYHIFTGYHAGLSFVPCDDDIMNTPLIGNPPLRPVDFPEFFQIIDDLGGLDARVDVNPQDIIDPDAPQEP
jgi:hypothetical protein